ncbi:hypothetical protein [Streptomyces celluloflavus]|uniref:hypothetical protein n=1 Tax=Streptomyces celluloflavus TaxID=58344 RepID=UPI0036D0F80C
MERQLIAVDPEFANSAGIPGPALWTGSVPGAAGSIRQHAGFEQVGRRRATASARTSSARTGG